MRSKIIFGALVAASFVYMTPTAFALELVHDEVRAFGTSGFDIASKITSDSSGNIYFIGSINEGTVDFDTTSEIDEQTNPTSSGYEPFLSKYNADGSYAWTKKWGGGAGNAHVSDMALDSNGNIFVTGEFSSTVDFDPGVGNDTFTSKGSVDMFITKYTTDGDYLWTKVMGAGSHDRTPDIIIDDSDDFYIATKFQLTVDFDPGVGTSTHTSNGIYDVALAKYTNDGEYIWSHAWGGTSYDQLTGIVIDSENEHLYLVGSFYNTVDFDTGTTTDYATSTGLYDVFYTKYTTDGEYLWTKTWGGTGQDYGHALFINSSNDTYITGGIHNTVDFDPGAGVDSYTSNGAEDAFLVKYDSGETYEWFRAWGGSDVEQLYAFTFDDEGNYYLGGSFKESLDFDPTETEDVHDSGDTTFALFVSAYTADDTYLETVTYGPTSSTLWYDNSVASLHVLDDTLHILGVFSVTSDFDPSANVALKTSEGSVDFYWNQLTIDTSVAEEENEEEESDEEEEEETSRSQSSQKGTTIQGQVKNLQKQGKTDEANALMQKWHWLFNTSDAEEIRAKQIAALIVELQKLIVLAEALGLTLNPLAYDLVG